MHLAEYIHTKGSNSVFSSADKRRKDARTVTGSDNLLAATKPCMVIMHVHTNAHSQKHIYGTNSMYQVWVHQASGGDFWESEPQHRFDSSDLESVLFFIP